MGRLTRDPEQRTMPSGRPVSNFGVATNRIWTDQESREKQEQTEYHNIVAFGKLAEICNQYLTKGQLILVEGRIQTRSWTDQAGNKRTRTEIIAESMQMGPRAGGRSSAEPLPEASETAGELPAEQIEEEPTESKKGKRKKPAKGGSALGGKEDDPPTEEIDVKDIPF